MMRVTATTGSVLEMLEMPGEWEGVNDQVTPYTTAAQS
jgi:hypothetical protein